MKYYSAFSEGLTPSQEKNLTCFLFQHLCIYLKANQKKSKLSLSIILMKKFANKKNYFFIIMKAHGYWKQNVLNTVKLLW